MDQISLRSQSHFIIAMLTYGRISHEAKGVLHGKEDAVVLSVHTCFTGESIYVSHNKTSFLLQSQSSHDLVGPTTVLRV